MSRPGSYAHLEEVKAEKAAREAGEPRESQPPPGQPTEPPPASPESRPTPTGKPRESQPRESRPAPRELSEGTGEGYWRMPNWIPDVLLPRLGPFEQLVLGRVLRLTLGFNREVCVCSHDRMAERLRVSRNTVKRAVKRLEDDGYITTRTVPARTPGHNATEYRLLAPARPPESQPDEGQPAKGRPRESQPGTARMTVSKDKREHAPAAAAPADRYSIRRAAAQIHEAEPDISHGELVAAVRRAFAVQGQGVGRDEIEAALEGLAL